MVFTSINSKNLSLKSCNRKMARYESSGTEVMSQILTQWVLNPNSILKKKKSLGKLKKKMPVPRSQPRDTNLIGLKWGPEYLFNF